MTSTNVTDADWPLVCTPAICPIDEYGQLNYIPNLGANAFFAALFSIGFILQTFFGIRYRTWGYMGSMLFGIGIELVGYAGRIMLHNDIYDRNNFIIYLVGTTIAPAFFSAAIYLCLARIVAIYGMRLSWPSPRKITVFFIFFDFVSLCLQAAGGALADLADTDADAQGGINIMIAGLAFQVGTTTIFCLICFHLMWRIRKNPHLVNTNTSNLRRTRSFKSFLVAIGIATITILIRCCFRVAELRGGFGGKLANNEVLFMILDGAMMIICVTALTTRHPGLVLGRYLWKDSSFKALGKLKSQRTNFTDGNGSDDITNGNNGNRKSRGMFQKYTLRRDRNRVINDGDAQEVAIRSETKA